MTTTYDDAIVVDYTVQPESSFIDGVAYDALNNVAYVVIDECAYTYGSVPYSAYVELATAESVGREYHNFSHIYGPSAPIWDAAFTLRNNEGPEEKDDNNFVTAYLGVMDNLHGEENVEAEKTQGEDVTTKAYSDPVAEATWQRREALELAVKIHSGTAQDDNIVIDTAEAFREYLNG